MGLALLTAVALALDDASIIVNTIMVSLSLTDSPQPAKYELFHTAYVNSSGITIVDQPLIPGANLTQYVQLALWLKSAYRNGTLYFTANETGIYSWLNGTLTYALTTTPIDDALVLKFTNWTTTQLDSNTWLNYTRIEANSSNFLLLTYVKYIDNTHKLYVITLAEEGGGRYARTFTWANYWFKNKTTYFGDWVVVEGAGSLSTYYSALANAVNALADKWKKDSGYVPQSYPQIAQALGQISRAVAGTRIDVPVDNGYGLVTDLGPGGAILIVNLAIGIGTGAYTGWKTWQRTGSVGRAVACGLWVGSQTFLAGAGAGLISLAGTVRAIFAGGAWLGYRTALAYAPDAMGLCG